MNGYVRDGASDEAPTDQPRCEGFWQVSHQRVKAAGGMPGQQGLTVGIGAMHWCNAVPVGIEGTHGYR